MLASELVLASYSVTERHGTLIILDLAIWGKKQSFFKMVDWKKNEMKEWDRKDALVL